MLRLILRSLLAFGGLIVFLAVWAIGFQPEVRDEPLTVDPVEAEEAERLRSSRIDPDNPPVVWREADYGQGESAPWWPKGEAPVLSDLVAEGVYPPVAERVGPEPVVLEGPDGVGRYGGTFIKAEIAKSGETLNISSSYSGRETWMRSRRSTAN